ncbi:MAG TPA: hypothetical protein VK208_15385 [Pyrinomonadaceae bacterium]|nr:hypothetical protein [Pyrinomonadaceae bacterium]
MRSFYKNSHMLSVALLGLALFLPACTHRKVVHFGTHKVTVSRHGFEKRLNVGEQDSIPTLEYAGLSADGKGLKVSIKGDKVRVNDVDYGRLRPGDSVLISDDGLAVNSMDYGESEKYLRANGSDSDTSSLHP